MRNLCLLFLLLVTICVPAEEGDDQRKIYLYLEGRSIFPGAMRSLSWKTW